MTRHLEPALPLGANLPESGLGIPLVARSKISLPYRVHLSAHRHDGDPAPSDGKSAQWSPA